MEKEKISIIVPIYNVEKYLPRCLNSILKQTYKNLEIILVDDGSQDSGGKICDAYAEKDSRICVIHQENGGLSAARNSGIDAASGDFLFFLDGDDFISPHALEKFQKKALETNADCVCGQMESVYIDKDGFCQIKKQKQKKTEPEIMNTKQALAHMLLHGSAACNRLLKRSLFATERFPLNQLNEDEITMLHIYEKCKKLAFLNESTYFYCKRGDSITGSKSSQLYMDFYCHAYSNLQYIREKYPSLQMYAECRLISSMVYCYYMFWKMNRSMTEQHFFLRLRKNIRSKEYQNMAKYNAFVSKRDKILMKAFLLI